MPIVALPFNPSPVLLTLTGTGVLESSNSAYTLFCYRGENPEGSKYLFVARRWKSDLLVYPGRGLIWNQMKIIEIKNWFPWLQHWEYKSQKSINALQGLVRLHCFPWMSIPWHYTTVEPRWQWNSGPTTTLSCVYKKEDGL